MYRSPNAQPRKERRNKVLTEPTLDKLKELALHGMAETLLAQQNDNDCAQLDFEDRLGLLVDAEWMLRQNKRLTRRLREAKLRIPAACTEDIDTAKARGLEKAALHRLASCVFIQERMSVLVTGPTGTGKTYLACALAQKACRQGFRAVYKRAGHFYDELNVARADGSYPRLLARLAKIDVLIIDDFGLGKMRDGDRLALLDVLEDRFNNRSTIITSQLPISAWHDYIAEPTMADAICDRIVHNAHRVTLKGASRRQIKEK